MFVPKPLHLRIFISSPRDVADERNLARRLLKDELPYDPFLRGNVTLDLVSWDDPAAPTPMLATLTPQEAVNRFGCRPSQCDIVIVVLWSRLGTHLDLSKFRKRNGKPYLSGTEYEYEEAANAEEPPDILVYRRIDRVLVDVDDPQLDDKIAQRRKAQAFFEQFKNPDGSYRGGFTDYTTPTEFVSRLEKDLKIILQRRLAPPAAPVVESLYSCFISYSSKDADFAEQLYADLQNRGVRCWWAPHDLPMGTRTWDAIDEAIRSRDKLLLILSKNAIASDWVEDEVSKAFDEERRRKQVVLFPVRIDQTVMKTDEPWAAKLRAQRNIGDFRNWKDHDAYQQAFDRVLRDLKQTPG